jgi:hypothetical protein
MSAMELRALTSLAPLLSAIPWTVDVLHSTAASGKMLPASHNDDLIEADSALVNAYWSVFAVLDPAQYSQYKNSFPYLYQDLKERLPSIFDVPTPEVRDAAFEIASFMAFELSRDRADHSRNQLDRIQRAELVDAAGPECRCWYCGYRFSDAVVAGFLKSFKVELKPSLLVDFVTPRGVRGLDLRIEVDHVQPLAAGGADAIDNMRLACAWCNRGKSSFRLLFESVKNARIIRHPSLGTVTVPASFWAIRVCAARRRCEYPGGCVMTLATTQLMIGPWRSGGAMVPGNLAVFCGEHDPLKAYRLVSPESLKLA